MKFTSSLLNGRRLCLHSGCRKALVFALALAIFLPTLVLTVSANSSADDPAENDHFVIYQAQNGETICRKATAAEARQLDKIKPKDLRPINHLSHDKLLSAEDVQSPLPQHLTIILRGTANLENNAPAKAAFIRAAQDWESRIISPVTIYIDADVGPDNFGSPWDAGVIGATSPLSQTLTYSQARTNLITGANTVTKLAVYNALPASSIPIDAGTGSATTLSVSQSVGRAIGSLDPTALATDSAARIGFNSAFTFDYDSSDGVIGRDFQSVATHEIGHALGFTSRSGSTNPVPAMWDLYRFRSGTTSASFTTAVRIMTIGGPTTNSQYYFVPDQPELGLSDGGLSGATTNNADGNQSSHWREAKFNNFIVIGIMDPTLPLGTARLITPNDTSALNIFGYNNNLPTTIPPANDNFANAQVLLGCSGSASGTNMRATAETGEQNNSPDEPAPHHSVWYQWQAPATGNVTFTTAGSGFDTVLAIYTGDVLGSLTNISKHDDVSQTDKTSSITFFANAGTTYSIAVDGYNNGGGGGDVGQIVLNWSASVCATPIAQLTQSTYTVNEGAGLLNVTVSRSGSLGGPTFVNYATGDSAGLTNCTTQTGIASERCDYGSTVGTLRFASGESSKSIIIPIVNDALVEGNENFTLSLSSPSGATFGSPTVATVTITDNDATPATQNPIDDIPFFVTQQYIDFLGRLPDATGFANWTATLNGCPNGGFGEFDNPDCDRVHVSAGFFLSAEFQGRGYFAYRFYEVALDRRPTYGEFVPDMAIVGGPQSPESEALSKAAYTDAWMQRPEFKSRYDALSDSAYVNALEANAEVTVTNKQTLIDALNSGQMNRGQVLRNIVESQAVANQFFNRAFVAMQYFGYLRRDPDTVGFQNWVNTLNADPSNFRHMIFGFLFSTEYRQRFGP